MPARRSTTKAKTTTKTRATAKPARTASATTKASKAKAKPTAKAKPSTKPKAPPARATPPMLAPGDAAPATPFIDHTGTTRSLRDLLGKLVLLTFYVKPSTPMCTTQVCELAPLASSRRRGPGLVVLAAGPGTARTHAKFAQAVAAEAGANALPLMVVDAPASRVADAPPALAQAFGAWGPKQMYGKTYMGVLRSSFLIGPDGKVLHVWPKVSAAGHAAEVRAWLEAHGS